MRSMKLLALMLLAIFSVSIAATSTAQAETLEFRILPEKAKFTFKSEGGTKLETLAGKVVECTSVSGSGEFTSARLGPVEFKFVGCKNPTTGVNCTGLEDATSGNITVKAEFHLRHLLMEKTTEPPLPEVSIMILVGHVHFTCLIALFLVLGSVCSDDILTKKGGELVVDKLVEKIWVDFLLLKPGDPDVTHVDTDNSLGMENCELRTHEGTAEYESSAQLGEGFIENCTEPGGKSCTFLIDLLGTY